MYDTQPVTRYPDPISAPPLPQAVTESMTINRVQMIKKNIMELRDIFERNLTAVLMPPQPAAAESNDPTNNRTYLERSLADVDLAIYQLRRVAERITL